MYEDESRYGCVCLFFLSFFFVNCLSFYVLIIKVCMFMVCLIKNKGRPTSTEQHSLKHFQMHNSKCVILSSAMIRHAGSLLWFSHHDALDDDCNFVVKQLPSNDVFLSLQC